MSKCALHMQKFAAGDLAGYESHIDRKYKSKTNLDIDYSRTRENYNIVAPASTIKQAIKNRLSELNTSRTVRKDAVLLCSWIVSAEKAFFESLASNRREQFFERAVSFFTERYGAKNIIQATVHLDEATPHLHLSIMPVVANSKLSAKELFNRDELKAVQTEFWRQVGREFGLERGVENSRAKHLSEIAFKQQKAAELNAEYSAKQTYLQALEHTPQFNALYPDYVKVSKHLNGKEFVTVPKDMWEARWVNANAQGAIRKAQEALEATIKEFSGYSPKEIKGLIEARSAAEDTAFYYSREVELAKGKVKAVRDEMLSKINETLDAISPAASREFADKWNDREQERERGQYNHER